MLWRDRRVRAREPEVIRLANRQIGSANANAKLTFNPGFHPMGDSQPSGCGGPRAS